MDIPKCIKEECENYALFGNTKPIYCEEHNTKEKRFKEYKTKLCIHPNCTTRACFNYSNLKIPVFCLKHKEPIMKNVIVKTCDICQKKTPRFNTKENYSVGPKYCKDCKNKHAERENMVDCIEKLCFVEGCWTQATFGYSKTDKERYCQKHKKDDMEDVKNLHRICNFPTCKTQANYNFPGETRAKFCKTHKEVGMVDTYHPKCAFEDCNLRPQYNIPGEKKGLFCKEHKTSEMEDVLEKNCQHLNCKKKAIYNFEELKPGFCGTHKQIDMVDVRRLLCELNTCYSQATHGYLGQTISRCATHKEAGMFRQSKRRCIATNCNETALFNNHGSLFPIYCEIHKKKENVNLVEQTCKLCGLDSLLNMDGHCIYCETKSGKTIMKKQYAVLHWLIENDYKILSHDRNIDGGICVKNRPDFVLESKNGGLIIILEVDEFQHRSHGYSTECERVRMINISQSFGQPTFFIRYNPDHFYINGKIRKDFTHKDRMSVVKTFLDQYMEIEVEEIRSLGFCSYIQLFYDEFNIKSVKPIKLLDFDI